MTFLSHKSNYNFSLTKIKLVYCLTRRHHIAKTAWRWVPQGPKQYIFGDHFYSKNAKKFRFHVFLLFHVRKYMTSSFYLKWTEFTRNFVSIVGPRGPELNWNKFTISCEFDPLQVKWWYHMFSSIKMEEYMEPELSGIFWVKMVAKNIVLGSPGTHFMCMRVNPF